MGRGAHDRPGATPACRRSRAELRRTVSASAPTTGTSGDHAWVDVPFKKGARYHVVANQAGTTKWCGLNAFFDQFGPPLQRI